jgi:hypothetical protein
MKPKRGMRVQEYEKKLKIDIERKCSKHMKRKAIDGSH